MDPLLAPKDDGVAPNSDPPAVVVAVAALPAKENADRVRAKSDTTYSNSTLIELEFTVKTQTQH